MRSTRSLSDTALSRALGRASFGTSSIALFAVAAACGTTKLDATQVWEESPDMSQGGAAPSTPSPDPGPRPTHETLTVRGGSLRDHCGQPVLLRGVNEMFVWGSPQDGTPFVSQIAQTGANAVRVVWLNDEDPRALAQALDNVRAEGMISVVEFHDRGDLDEETALAAMVEGWTDTEMVDVLDTRRDAVLVELGSGVAPTPQSEWVENFSAAVLELRNAGLRMPIAIRIPFYPGGLNDPVAAVTQVVASDPLQNSLVATFFWNGDEETFEQTHEALAEAGVASFIAEFAAHQSGICPRQETDVVKILEFSQRLGVGWFAWSWGGVPNPTCLQTPADMSDDGTISGLVGWGRTVALADPGGISRTSVPITTWGRSECPN